MATTIIHDTTGQPPVDDPFHDPVLLGIGVTYALVSLLILALTGLLIWGVQYGVPPWNTASFPPPLVH